MKILMINENIELCDFLSDYLENFGITVDAAYFGKIGFRMGFSGNYDMIVISSDMSDISGFNVLKKLRANGVYTPVIMLAEKDTEKFETLGADCCAFSDMVKRLSR